MKLFLQCIDSIQFYHILMTESPLQILQQRDSIRKRYLQEAVDSKHLKARLITCHFKPNIGETQLVSDKYSRPCTADQSNRINFNSSLKKSFFYRKLLNKSIESHITSDQFLRYKKKFSNTNNNSKIKQNKSCLFRQIWQHQTNMKLSQRLNAELQNSLEIDNKHSQNGQHKNFSFQEFIENKKHIDGKRKKIGGSKFAMFEENPPSITVNLQIAGNNHFAKGNDSILIKGRNQKQLFHHATKQYSQQGKDKEIRQTSWTEYHKNSLEKLEKMDIDINCQKYCTPLKANRKGKFDFCESDYLQNSTNLGFKVVSLSKNQLFRDEHPFPQNESKGLISNSGSKKNKKFEKTVNMIEKNIIFRNGSKTVKKIEPNQIQGWDIKENQDFIDDNFK